MMIVFTGKTFGLQVVELAKPFIKKYVSTIMETSAIKASMRAVDSVLEEAENIASYAMTEDMKTEMGFDDDSRQNQQEQRNKQLALEERTKKFNAQSSRKITNTYELQTHMVNYEEKGTFDDFNEMAIQYAR